MVDPKGVETGEYEIAYAHLSFFMTDQRLES
jgi:hypothetical protein